jgi:hypothetical protein
MTEPLSDSAIALLFAVARRQGWSTWNQLVEDLGGKLHQAPASMTTDMARLVKDGSVQVRGSMTAPELEAEYRQACAALKQAQAAGTAFTWRTRQTMSYALTTAGADLVNLLREHLRDR